MNRRRANNHWRGWTWLARLAMVAMVARAAIAGAAAAGPGAIPRLPRMSPDYGGITIPPNIAPLNFVLKEEPGRYRVRFAGPHGRPVEVAAADRQVRIPGQPWHELLQANSGGPVWMEVTRQNPPPGAAVYLAVTNQVAREPIDGWLAYRLIKPLYNLYVEVGIYQRNLASFEQREILHNRRFDQGCVNCHTFRAQDPDTLALHIRTKTHGAPMLIQRGGEVLHVAKPAGYLGWHPSGQVLAFSNNKLSLIFHTTGESRDVFDAASDVGVYDVEANTIQMPAATADPQWQETWPAWSPDGQYLYFCRAPRKEPAEFRQVLYDLARVRFDLATRTWGEPETLVAAAEIKRSTAQPRISPDGRWLVFCEFPYGNFPVYQPGSDLHLMNLETRQVRRLALNSERAESWHGWSANGRWLVFSSKRRDGLFARPHFSYFDPAGREHKPFILPQRDPEFYDSCLQTFNVPEFITGPVRVPPEELARAILAPKEKRFPKAHPDPRRPAPAEAGAGNAAELTNPQ